MFYSNAVLSHNLTSKLSKKPKIILKLKGTFEPNFGQIAKKGSFPSSPFNSVYKNKTFSHFIHRIPYLFFVKIGNISCLIENKF